MPGVHVFPMGDEALLVAPAHEQAHAVNASAAAIFDLCNGVRTIHDIAVELSEIVNRGADELVADVLEGVRQLHDTGLVAVA